MIQVFSVDGRQPLLGSVVVVMSLPFDHTLRLVPSLFGWRSRNVEQSTQQPLRRDTDSTTIYLTCRYIKSNGGTRIPSPTLREHVRKLSLGARCFAMLLAPANRRVKATHVWRQGSSAPRRVAVRAPWDC